MHGAIGVFIGGTVVVQSINACGWRHVAGICLKSMEMMNPCFGVSKRIDDQVYFIIATLTLAWGGLQTTNKIVEINFLDAVKEKYFMNKYSRPGEAEVT